MVPLALIVVTLAVTAMWLALAVKVKDARVVGVTVRALLTLVAAGSAAMLSAACVATWVASTFPDCDWPHAIGASSSRNPGAPR